MLEINPHNIKVIIILLQRTSKDKNKHKSTHLINMGILTHNNSNIDNTSYDYNLTIMKSPKPATDNRFKK
jgi:hypothetical protein